MLPSMSAWLAWLLELILKRQIKDEMVKSSNSRGIGWLNHVYPSGCRHS